MRHAEDSLDAAVLARELAKRVRRRKLALRGCAILVARAPIDIEEMWLDAVIEGFRTKRPAGMSDDDIRERLTTDGLDL